MPSTLPLVLGVLTFTGAVSGLWRLLRALLSRRNPSAARSIDANGLRIQATTELLWTILLLVQFVMIEALSESREVAQGFAIVAGVIGAVCLIAALVSLVSCISAERSLISSR